MGSDKFGVQMQELAKIQKDWHSVSERMNEMSKKLGKIEETIAKAVAVDLASSQLAGIPGFGIAFEVLKDAKDIAARASHLAATKEKLTKEIAQDAQKIKAVMSEYEAIEHKIEQELKKHDKKHEKPKSPGGSNGTRIDGTGKGGSKGGGHHEQPKSPGDHGGGGDLKDHSTGDWKTHTDSRGWDGWSTSGKRHPRNGEGKGVEARPKMDGLSDERKGILDRALDRAEHKLGYSQSSVTNGYRVDCSGLVSAAWGLKGPGLNTWGLMEPSVSHQIGKSDLKPGDAMISGEHTVIFGGWADAAHTRYVAIEDSGSQGCVSHVIPYPYYPGSGPYHPYRRNGVE